MLDGAEEERVQHAIIDVLAENYDLIAQAQEANCKVEAVCGTAQAGANKLRESLIKLQAQSASTAQAGNVWRRKKQVLSSAVAQHQRLLALAEAPALVEECIRGEMYHEALLVTEHMLRGQAYAEQGSGFFARVNARMRDAIECSLEEVVLPRLSGPLSVDAAFKIATFLRRLGTGTDRLRTLFLERRTLFIDRLKAEADSSPAPYSRILKHINVFKVHVSEAVMQYSACFPATESREWAGGDSTISIWDSHLRLWCQEQTRRYVAAFASTIREITNGAELALVVEQCSSCSVSASKLHMDASLLINQLISARVKEVFANHMDQAVSAYTASMRAFSWRMPPSYAAAYGASGTTNAQAAGAAPLVLAQWLPLAYALNGLLTAFNAIRKCLVSGVEYFCVDRVAGLVARIASDLLRDGDLASTMEEAERRIYNDLVTAFVNIFYPHVITCTRKLMTTEVTRWMELALAEAMDALLRRLPASVPPPEAEPSIVSDTAPAAVIADAPAPVPTPAGASAALRVPPAAPAHAAPPLQLSVPRAPSPRPQQLQYSHPHPKVLQPLPQLQPQVPQPQRSLPPPQMGLAGSALSTVVPQPTQPIPAQPAPPVVAPPHTAPRAAAMQNVCANPFASAQPNLRTLQPSSP